jgi:hypothetical protein
MSVATVEYTKKSVASSTWSGDGTNTNEDHGKIGSGSLAFKGRTLVLECLARS